MICFDVCYLLLSARTGTSFLSEEGDYAVNGLCWD